MKSRRPIAFQGVAPPTDAEGHEPEVLLLLDGLLLLKDSGICSGRRAAAARGLGGVRDGDGDRPIDLTCPAGSTTSVCSFTVCQYYGYTGLDLGFPGHEIN